MDAKLLEQWLRLSADAVKGAEQAREALEALGAGPLSPEAVDRWVRAWLPQEERPAEDAGAQLRDWVEQWWKAIGVVPRYRYLELLERCEQLKARLEAAEETVRRLREVLGDRERTEEAREALARWEELTRQVVETQLEWARAWTGSGGEADDDEKASGPGADPGTTRKGGTKG